MGAFRIICFIQWGQSQLVDHREKRSEGETNLCKGYGGSKRAALLENWCIVSVGVVQAKVLRHI